MAGVACLGPRSLAQKGLPIVLEDRDLAWVVERLDSYAGKYGERLRPAALPRDMAGRKSTFY
jgi:hypothetical protein